MERAEIAIEAMDRGRRWEMLRAATERQMHSVIDLYDLYATNKFWKLQVAAKYPKEIRTIWPDVLEQEADLRGQLDELIKDQRELFGMVNKYPVAADSVTLPGLEVFGNHMGERYDALHKALIGTRKTLIELMMQGEPDAESVAESMSERVKQ